MNESELESRLRLLEPVAPSPELEDRIALALESQLAVVPLDDTHVALRYDPPRPPAWLRFLQGTGWAMAGAAAGVAAMWYWQGAAPTHAAVASLFQPGESAREIISSQEEGTVFGDGDEPARLVRYTSIERHRWTNPATGASVQVEVPREDLVALPVSYQ